MIAPEWLWIPVTIGAALAQTVRNAAQRHLTPILGTLGATLVRFLYGLPFTLVWLVIVAVVGGFSLPQLNTSFVLWTVVSSITQIGATACLLRAMEERNFALAITYSKTEVIQVALFGLIFLGDRLTVSVMLAIFFCTVGVVLVSPIDPQRPLRTLVSAWTTRAAVLGILSGGCFGFAAVGYRGAALALDGTPFPMAAATALVAAQSVQTLLLGGWLLVRTADVVARALREWKTSLFVGSMGAIGSVCWFTAFTIEPAAHVRTLALIEILFGYGVSRRFFRERVTRLEVVGMLLLMLGLVVVTLGR